MTATKVLVIDDEPQIRRLLRHALEGLDWRVFEAATGREGISETASRLPDLVILDLGLPDITGFNVLARLREWTSVPVLILSVHDSEDEKVAALDGGADDYVTKPFNTQELLARLRVLLRRTHDDDEPIFQRGALTIDFAAHLVKVGSEVLELTTTEYSLLRILAQHAGKIVTHKQLLADVWGPNAVEQSQYLRVFMSHIRRKLSSRGIPSNAIRTEVGVGYRLDLE